MSEQKGRRVSLVLGSGGARGLAHIGIIRWLEEAGYRIDSIAGASMGALVGGIYAAGKLDSYRDWVCALRSTDVLRFLDLSFSVGGLFKGERIIDTLREMVGDHAIEDLPLPTRPSRRTSIASARCGSRGAPSSTRSAPRSPCRPSSRPTSTRG